MKNHEKDESPILVLGVLGSPRKEGNTMRLLNIILNEAKNEGAQTETIYLIDNPPRYCLGCYADLPESCNPDTCTKGDLNDGMKHIFQKFLQADGVVFATPVYWFAPSGLMKTLIDRLTALENAGKLLDGKVAGFLATYEEDGATMALLSMVGPILEMGFLIPPYALVFTRKGIDGDNVVVADAKRLAKNIVALARFQRKEPRNWWKADFHFKD